MPPALLHAGEDGRWLGVQKRLCETSHKTKLKKQQKQDCDI